MGRHGVVGASGWSEARVLCLRVARSYYRSDPAEAEDIAQDALLRAWRREATLGDRRRRRAWLTAIARHEAFRHYARRTAEPVARTDRGGGAEDHLVEATADRADLQTALASIPKADQLLLHLRYVEDLTQAAIAELLDVPLGTVKVRLHRARVKLRMAHSQRC